MAERVILGMSGGTDSSVSALLLLDKGYHVIGVTLRLWSQMDSNDGDSEPQYITNARNLANELGIEHHVVDVREMFYRQIIGYFVNEYANGRTPNPCARCNPTLKWHILYELSEKFNCSYIATGHYVGIEVDNGLLYIIKGTDEDKEQSFFLWGLNQDILKKAVFPLSGLTKNAIRKVAENRGFKRLSTLKESIGICFINGMDYRPFIKEMLNKDGLQIENGSFVDIMGNRIGQHLGYPFYTVGQRRGLGLTPDTPWYVSKILPETNTIVLGKHADLYKKNIQVCDYKIVNKTDFVEPVEVRVRYRKQNARGKVQFINAKQAIVDLDEPEWSIAPGQTIAFYRNKRLLGGGFIEG